MDIFIILVGIVVSQMYTYAKTYTVHFKYVQPIVCQLYYSKVLFLKHVLCVKITKTYVYSEMFVYMKKLTSQIN